MKKRILEIIPTLGRAISRIRFFTATRTFLLSDQTFQQPHVDVGNVLYFVLAFNKGFGRRAHAACLVDSRETFSRGSRQSVAIQFGNQVNARLITNDASVQRGIVHCNGQPRCHRFQQERVGLAAVAADAAVIGGNSGESHTLLLEAMAAGLPIAVNDTPLHRSVVGDESCVHLVPELDSDGLGEILVRTFHDVNEARRMGAAAKTLVEREYEIENVADVHMRLLESLVRK